MNAINYWFQKYLAEKKKVVELEEQVKNAEDHAYFAGANRQRDNIISQIEKLHNEWRFLSSIEAKYRAEAYKELLETLKEE